MADPALLQALDYILNQSDDSSIAVLAEAVVRRRRDLSVFNAIGNIPDPQQLAKKVSKNLNASTKKIADGMRHSIQEMIVRLLREHAPELTNKQINELCQTWIPSPGVSAQEKQKANKSKLPVDVLLSMIEQFISFSHGTMRKKEDESLRKELGPWPEIYWKSFPPVIKQITKDYLNNKITEKDFRSKVLLALG